MKQIYGLFGLLLLSQITGCASLMTPTGSADEQIGYWLNQQEYAKASSLLAELKTSSPQAPNYFQEIQDTLNTQTARYEQQVIQNAELSVVKNEWSTALDLYQEALSRVPDSRRLQQGYQQLLQRQAETLEKLELERLIAKGEWTLKDLEISRLAVNENTNSWFGGNPLDEKIADAHELAIKLTNHGKHALEGKDLALAKQTLPLAKQLSPTTEIKKLNDKLQEILKEQEVTILNEQKRITEAQLAQQKMISKQQAKKRRSTLHYQEQKKAKRLLADFKNSLDNKHLTEARQIMATMEKQDIDTQEYEKLSKQLDNEVAGQVSHLTEIGVTYYSQQQYDQAMNAWKKAQVLDPSNEQLTDHIERATRVLEKLHDLRKKSGARQ